MKKVLIVEDDGRLQKAWRTALEDEGVVVFQAFTVSDARSAFYDNSDLDVIAIDACVPGTTPTTYNLVREIRNQFTGVLLAISADRGFRKELIELGCDLECPKDKVIPSILQILNIGRRLIEH